MTTFEIAEDGFRRDGEPFHLISGSLHYFRVHPDHWADRIEKARQLGLNAIDTYVAWNFHSSTEGEFRLDHWRDLGAFLDLVAKAGLLAIVRPGPYICAEWSNAGLPSWLTAKADIALRTADPRYLEAVNELYSAVLPLVAERQVTRGGNVAMVQIENEYGAYGDDKSYLRALVDLVRGHGIDVPLFTCDQANDEMLSRGGLPELLTTATFGSRSKERLEVLRRHQPTGPLMCTEFWDGWFDAWGQHHRTSDPAESARDLDDLLAVGASVNLYMFHGGTNFSGRNGANHKGAYTPTVTSYDYDAPLREDGSPGPKYWAFREVIARHAGVPDDAPSEFEPAPEFNVPLAVGPAWEDLPRSAEATYDHLPTLDEVAPEALFAVYETEILPDDAVVSFTEVRDRARVDLNGAPVGMLNRHHHERTIALPAAGGTLRVLVEDMGRVNYGSHLGEAKGLVGPALTAHRQLDAWTVWVPDLDALPGYALAAVGTELPADQPVAGPALLTATFDGKAGTDLFLDTSGWGHGAVWVNGFFLGRYWSAGPTRTLYVPGPLLQAARNTLVVWEQDACPRPEATFVSHPNLGHTEA